MPSFTLASLVKRPSKRPIVLPKIAPTQAQASDLATIYLTVVARWNAAIDTIIAEYARTLSSMTSDAPSDLQGNIDSVAAEIQRLVLLLTPDLRRWAYSVERVHRGKWARSVLSATDVDLTTVLSQTDVEQTVDSIVSWNVSLVRDVSDEARKRIANAVFTGLQQRKAATDVAKEIRDATGMARARSIRIAGDQTTRLGGRLNQARQEQAGISHYKWRHSSKRHPRTWHLNRDGRIFPWEGPGSIAPDDRPSIPIFCGCTAQAVLTFDDENAK